MRLPKAEGIAGVENAVGFDIASISTYKVRYFFRSLLVCEARGLEKKRAWGLGLTSGGNFVARAEDARRDGNRAK